MSPSEQKYKAMGDQTSLVHGLLAEMAKRNKCLTETVGEKLLRRQYNRK
jgi:hypothetical protein